MSNQSSNTSGTTLTDAERKALIKAEEDRLSREDTLNDVRAEQQMIEGAVDTDDSVRRMERQRSMNQDEPDDDLDRDDPVPPKGI